MDRCEYHLRCEGPSGSFKRLQPKFRKCRHCGIKPNGDPGDPRRNLLEQFQPLAGLRRFRNGETGNVAARSQEARDEAAANRIGNNPENDGDGARLLQQRCGGGGALRKNEVGRKRDKPSPVDASTPGRRVPPNAFRSADCRRPSSPVSAAPGRTLRARSGLPDRSPASPSALRSAASGQAAAPASQAAKSPRRREA